MTGERKKRGRRPEQHGAIKRRIAEARVPSFAQAATDVLDGWISGEASFDDLLNALSELEGQTESLGMAPPADDEFTAVDEVAWAALNYRDAAFLTSRLALMAAAAAARRDELQATLISAVATKPALPTYARRFFDALKAVGVGQDLLHPATRPKAERVKAALTASAAGDERVEFAEGPIHQWSDLPRAFAGYELVDTDDRPGFGSDDDLVPLPPLCGIEMYAEAEADIEGQLASSDTLKKYAKVVDQWARKRGDPISGITAWGWALLLSYRLKGTSDIVPEVAQADMIFASPWKAGKAVRAVKLPVD